MPRLRRGGDTPEMIAIRKRIRQAVKKGDPLRTKGERIGVVEELIVEYPGEEAYINACYELAYNAALAKASLEHEGLRFQRLRRFLPGHSGFKVVSERFEGEGKDKKHKVTEEDVFKRKVGGGTKSKSVRENIVQIRKEGGSITLKAPVTTKKDLTSLKGWGQGLRQFGYQCLLLGSGVGAAGCVIGEKFFRIDLAEVGHTREDLPVLDVKLEKDGSLKITHLGMDERIGTASSVENAKKTALVVETFMKLHKVPGEEKEYEQPVITGFGPEFRARLVDKFLERGIVPGVGESEASEVVPQEFTGGRKGVTFDNYIRERAGRLGIDMTKPKAARAIGPPQERTVELAGLKPRQ